MNTALAMLAAEKTASAGQGIVMILGYVIVFGAFIYFLMIRPQKKQQAQMNTLLSSLEIGDSVLTTSGFYGVVIDINDDVVIVEFGNNKNCRIPMQKAAIVDVEKAADGIEK
ncbi:MAG: preprotein translocase subunit YajC [Lachnospiraceae bacterium]|jgi:preprotein translocase subunit YajC|uniref:preprotein translocase subunit YajC n=1 Tax=Bovifimicola ammoniilytica TaxID=2981720 RepID=UPI000334EEDD|nr:preprotein translocase subunit YajC [Bovifimicola ammoniilytica]MCI5603856.1 preprotein translocase subunit YajC [Clostridiales bacterium]MDD6292358.1 preprotein translocase subunit YajC [Eubacteriales bacterium]MDY2606723.1 preprotein translocase subunit YajC [Lachnospiraceae bacterium]CCZ03524.1 preprotein translocase subunit [Eubacterium sp. CAG:603]SCJ71798.1 preprotein translocase subunit YajC [uncultured Eubacterium sp.]